MIDERNQYADDDVRALLGAHVIGAVDDLERRRVEQAAATDPDIDAEIDRLRRGVDVLADSTDSTPPPQVWESILTRLDDRPDSSSDVSAPETVPNAERRRPIRLLLAAASVAVVVVLGGAVLVGRGGDPDSTDTLAAMTAMAIDAAKQPGSRTGVLTDPARSMEVQVIADAEGHGFLMADALPPLPADETYQVWSSTDGTMISLGMIGSNPTMALVPIDSAVTELALTREPIEGSVAPTSPPMATGALA